MAMDVTLFGRVGMDLGWINWDLGLDLVGGGDGDGDDVMRCDAMVVDVTCVGRGGMDSGWYEWDGAW